MCLMLAATFTTAGCSVATEQITDAVSQETDVQPRVASEYGLVRPNTLEDAISLPAVAGAYFDPQALGEPSGEIAYSPDKVFQRSVVSFGERNWERVAPNRFEMSGTDGEASVVFSNDFSRIEFRIGPRRIPVSFEGTLAERQVSAGLFAVLGMSGVEPTEEVYEAAAAAGAGLLPFVGAIVLLVGGIAITCAALVTSCNANATQACTTGVASVAAPCTISGGTSPSISFSCSWVCNAAGGGSGSGGGSGGDGGGGVDTTPLPTGETAGESETAGNDDGGGDGDGDGGDDDSDDDSDDGDCGGEASAGFSLGSIPGPDGGMLDYASAEDGGGDSGGDGGDDGGSSTGC